MPLHLECGCSILGSVTPFFGDWKLDAALGSCLLLGLRHGFDYDHLAAISDITAVQKNWWNGFAAGDDLRPGARIYCGGLGSRGAGTSHGLARGAGSLDGAADWSDSILLGVGVVAGILRKDAHGHTHSRIESRLAIAINGLLWMVWRVRRMW